MIYKYNTQSGEYQMICSFKTTVTAGSTCIEKPETGGNEEA